jgi:hypothetical protein
VKKCRSNKVHIIKIQSYEILVSCSLDIKVCFVQLVFFCD